MTKRTVLIRFFGHTAMAREVLVCKSAEPHHKIIGVRTPGTPRMDACARPCSAVVKAECCGMDNLMITRRKLLVHGCLSPIAFCCIRNIWGTSKKNFRLGPRAGGARFSTEGLASRRGWFGWCHAVTRHFSHSSIALYSLD
jgi:hypothetical protein